MKKLYEKKSLGEVVEGIFLGLSLSRQPKGNRKPFFVPMLTAKDLVHGFLPPRSELQESEVPESSQTERFRLQAGDVVMTARGSIKVAGVRPEHVGTIAGPNLIVVRPGTTLAGALVLAFLRHPSTLEDLARLSVGTTVPSINVSTVAALEILVPPLDRQSKLSRLIELGDEHFSAARRAAELRHKLAQEIAIRELTK